MEANEQLFYHYTDQHGLLGIFESRNLWATNIHYLNDVKEFAHAIDVVKTLIRQHEKESNNSKISKLYPELLKRIDCIERVNIFVSSLTTEGNLLSQWRAYCPAEPGFSIGFTKESIANLSNKQGFAFAPCIYDYDMQTIAMHRILTSTEESFIRMIDSPDINLRESIEIAVSGFVDAVVHTAPLLKHSTFSEEKEWRLVSGLVRYDDTRWKTRVGRKTLIPYIEFNLEINNTLQSIRDIYVGPGSNQDLAGNAIMSLFKQANIEKGSVTYSQIPYRSW